MSENKHVDLKNSRIAEQKKVMQQIVEDDNCPFCKESLDKYHKEPILKEGEFWLTTKNQWPYEGTKHHFILILKRHAEHISELSPQEFEELGRHWQWLCEEYDIEGGSSFIRFGNTKYTGGSVKHIHAQLLQGNVDEPNHQSVKVKLG